MPGDAEYQRVSGAVRLRVLQFAQTAFESLGRWRTADIDRFVAQLVPVVVAGQRQVATLTDLYLSQQLTAMYGAGAAVGGALDLDALSGAALRGGTDPEEVYRRPAVALYTALSRGAALPQAVREGTARLTGLISTDMQLARTHTTRARLSQSPAQYYQRTLSGTENCALCVVASTQRYRTDELMPIHPGCDCGVAPARSGSPHVLDRARLEQIHGAVEAYAGRIARDAREVDYREILVTHTHGEYGPTLAYRGQHFDGPGAVK